MRAYGLGDGLPTTECSSGFQPASCKTADGCLWFPTRRGLVRVNPAMLVTNSLPPPVRIESLQVQDEEVAIPGNGLALRIPPGRERFEFQFTALSFVAPEKVRFKYRLSGLERDWVERSERNAAYSHLPPGDYVFHVVACNNDGVWNDAAATLAFTVLPYFWLWAINPRHDTLDSLAGYLVRFAQDFLGPVGIRCRVDMPLTLPGWPLGAELRHNVFLAFKEAIHNAVRHAHAHEVKIALHPRNDGFELVVEDDGRGFDPPPSTSSGRPQPGRPGAGNGLRNMQARLNDLGGAVSIRSDPGSGTTVSFRIPVQHRNPA